MFTYKCLLIGSQAGGRHNVRHHMLKLISCCFCFMCRILSSNAKFSNFWLNYLSVKERDFCGIEKKKHYALMPVYVFV